MNSMIGLLLMTKCNTTKSLLAQHSVVFNVDFIISRWNTVCKNDFFLVNWGENVKTRGTLNFKLNIKICLSIMILNLWPLSAEMKKSRIMLFWEKNKIEKWISALSNSLKFIEETYNMVVKKFMNNSYCYIFNNTQKTWYGFVQFYEIITILMNIVWQIWIAPKNSPTWCVWALMLFRFAIRYFHKLICLSLYYSHCS